MQTNKIAYWTATVLVAAMMLLNGALYLFADSPQISGAFAHLGYPPYFRTYLGVAKLLGAVALLVPKYPRLTEWAYAGFTFTFLAAAWSHYSSGDGPKAFFPLVFLALLAVSYRLRERKGA